MREKMFFGGDNGLSKLNKCTDAVRKCATL